MELKLSRVKVNLFTCLIISNHSPVWVRICACKDFSRGNTREQTLHLIPFADRAPSRIRDEIFSALGRPRLLSLLIPPGGSPSNESASCELVDEDRGLNVTLDSPSVQFQGYIFCV